MLRGSYDIALLDLSERARSGISARGLYAIERGGEALLRSVRWGAQCHYLVTDAEWNRPIAWERVRMPAQQFHQAVKARVVWLGRERDRDNPDQRGRLLYDPTSS